MNDAHHADRMEHQRINRTNQLTFDLDKQTARELGKKSWKFWRKESAITLSETGKPNHPHKTSGRREMRALMESLEKIQPMLFPHKLKAGEFYTRAQLQHFRQFTSEDHDNSTRPNRAQRRKMGKGAVPRGMFRRSSREWGGLTNPFKLEEVFGEDIDRGIYGGP